MGKVSGAHLNPAVSLAFAACAGLPVATGARLHRRPTRRRGLAALFLQRSSTCPASYGSNYPAAGYYTRVGVLDGGCPHARPRERHPRHRVRRTEHRHLRRVRRGRLHRARRSVGQPDLGHVDEPGSHLRPRPRRRATSPTTGSTSPARSSVRRSRSAARSSSAGGAGARADRARHRARSTQRWLNLGKPERQGSRVASIFEVVEAFRAAAPERSGDQA